MDLSKLNVLMADVVRRCRAEEGIGYHVLGHQELEMKELVRITKNGFGLLTVGNFIDGNCYRVCRVPSLRYSANNLLAECCAENVWQKKKHSAYLLVCRVFFYDTRQTALCQVIF